MNSFTIINASSCFIFFYPYSCRAQLLGLLRFYLGSHSTFRMCHCFSLSIISFDITKVRKSIDIRKECLYILVKKSLHIMLIYVNVCYCFTVTR